MRATVRSKPVQPTALIPRTPKPLRQTTPMSPTVNVLPTVDLTGLFDPPPPPALIAKHQNREMISIKVDAEKISAAKFEAIKRIDTQGPLGAEAKADTEEPQPVAEANPGGFGLSSGTKASRPNETGPSSDAGCDFDSLTPLDEIRAKQLSQSELEEFKIFKGYNPGEPTSRLCLKNVAMGVSEAELRSIFGNFVDFQDTADRNAFDVRLLSTGRMRGQAFVALGSVDNAKRALRVTNGVVLDGKPIVVCYARSKNIQ